MIASKCILSTFPGNGVPHVPLTNARGRVANRLRQRCAGSARQDKRRRQLRGPGRSTAQETGGAVPGAKRKARQTRSLPSPSKFALNVAANLTLFKTGFFS